MRGTRSSLHRALREARVEGEKLLRLVAKLGAWSLLDDWVEGRISARELRERLQRLAEERGSKSEPL